MWIEEKLIEGDFVTLEPLRLEHVPALIEAVKDGEHWKLGYANVPCPNQMPQYVQDAIEASSKGNIAYAVRTKSTNNIVGTTRFYNVDNSNRRAMIGYTWYSDAVRRSLLTPNANSFFLEKYSSHTMP